MNLLWGIDHVQSWYLERNIIIIPRSIQDVLGGMSDFLP